MILSLDNKKPRIGVHPARIVSMQPKNDKQGQPGLECTFRTLDDNVVMNYVFWLKKELDYQLKSFNKIVLGLNATTIRVNNLIGNNLFIVVQQILYYRGGEQIKKITGEDVVQYRVSPKFYPYDKELMPRVNEKYFTVIKYLDGEGKLTYEQNNE